MRQERQLLQGNMFTGEWDDNRSSAQKRLSREWGRPRQIPMFSINDVVRLGERAQPWLREVSRGQLVLEREDIRAEEEVERDRRREAEALTDKMFKDAPALYGETKPENTANTEPDALPRDDDIYPDHKSGKQAAYLVLVDAARERATTMWVDDAYRQRFANQLPLAILSAQRAGLTSGEIAAAMQVGELVDGGDSRDQTRLLVASNGVVKSRNRSVQPIGYRARARQSRALVRRRTWNV